MFIRSKGIFLRSSFVPKNAKYICENSFSTSTTNIFGTLLCSNKATDFGKLIEDHKKSIISQIGERNIPLNNVGVLGAGLMGSGVANVSIQNGLTAIVRDINEKNLDKTRTGIKKKVNKLVESNKITKSEGEKYLSRLVLTTNAEQFSKADIVIEAVFEDLSLKHEVIKEIEEIIPEHCIFATNTSALPITEIAKASKRPNKVIGMHYFSPVEKMKLLEIIQTKETSEETLHKSLKIALQQKKIPIIVKDGPGFYTTRLIMAVEAEGYRLLLEGADPIRVDKMGLEVGFPVGTITLWDEVGIDVTTHIYLNLIKEFGERYETFPAKFGEELISAGILGRKSGKGFFLYQDKSKKPINQEFLNIVEKFRSEPKTPLTDENIKLRLLYRFVNEAILCLQQGIISTPREGDIGAVLGLGFPPSTGGPFRFIDTQGAQGIVDKMREIEELCGPSFTPCQLLLDCVKHPEKRFYKE